MASDIWLRTILIVRKETRYRYISYSYRLTARVILYAPSHRQDNTYHGLCYTSRGALAGTRNSSIGPPHEGSIRRSCYFSFQPEHHDWWNRPWYVTGVGSGGGGGGGRGQGGHVPPPPTFLIGGQWYVCAHPLLTPHFYFPLELYVCITLTNNYLAFFIYQLIILWTISINWHRWLLLNNHTSKYNSFIIVLYRRYINYVSVCPPPPPPPPLFGIFLRHCMCYPVSGMVHKK